ncbi:MAG: hypothetical protein AB8H86_28510 [Polyangiales bacterium]
MRVVLFVDAEAALRQLAFEHGGSEARRRVDFQFAEIAPRREVLALEAFSQQVPADIEARPTGWTVTCTRNN